jgi:AcrR family transcriptional regulator
LETKDRILQTTEHMLQKYGYKKVRTDDIAKNVGISKRTLYEHFSSKESLVESLLTEKFEVFKSEIHSKLEIMKSSDASNFVSILRDINETVANYFSFFNKDLHEDIEKNLPDFMHKCKTFEDNKFEVLKKIFEYGREKKKVKDNVDFEILYLISKYAIESLMKPEVIKELPYSTKDIITNIHSILMTGILTDDASNEFLEIKSN